MRVNSRVSTERQGLFSIQIPNCQPPKLRAIAENIIMMVTKPGYSVSDYNNATELDKILMWDYWQEYDGMSPAITTLASFQVWFQKHATAPEYIRRARQWLVEHNYLILKESVSQHAYEAGEKFSRSIKQGG